MKKSERTRKTSTKSKHAYARKRSVNKQKKLDHVVFYDGECGFCNEVVQFLLRIDPQERLLFAPLQGKTAKHLLPKSLTKELSTFVLKSNGKLYTKSTAVLRIGIVVGGIGTLGWGGYIIPRFARDKMYDLVGRNRHKIFKNTCMINPPMQRFLP